MEWLDTVMEWGGEVTKYLKRKGQFKGKRDWNEIQHSLYRERVFDVNPETEEDEKVEILMPYSSSIERKE